MIFKLGHWINVYFQYGLPVSCILAFCDLLFNTGLSLTFGGYNALRVKTLDGFRMRSVKKGD